MFPLQQRAMTRQPQGVARLSTGRLAQGIVFIDTPTIAASYRNTQDNADVALRSGGASFSTLNRVGSAAGWYWSLPSSHPLYSVTGDITYGVFGAAHTAHNSYPAMLTVPPVSGVLSGPYATQALNGDGSFGVLIGGSNYGTAGSSVGDTTNTKSNYIGIRRGTTLSSYKNGVENWPSASCPSGALDWGTKQPLALHGITSSLNQGSGMTGTVELIVIWGRALEVSEVRELNNNYWQVLAELPRWLYTSAGAGSWTPLEVQG